MAALLIERGAALTPLSAAALGRLGLDPDERTQLGQHEDRTFSAGGPLLEAVNTGRIDMARVLLDHGADPNAQVFTAGSPTFAAYNGGSPRGHAPDPAMIDLMRKHGGWIDAASVGYLREVEIARRMLAGEIDPHLEFGTFSGQTVAEQILWTGASGRSPDIVRMALERIDLAAGRPAMALDAVASAARWSWSHCRWLEGPIRSNPRPSRGPHRSRGPNGVNMRGLHRSSGNTELTDSYTRSLTTSAWRLVVVIRRWTLGATAGSIPVWLTSSKPLIQNDRNLDPKQEIEPARLPAIQLMPACRVIVRS